MDPIPISTAAHRAAAKIVLDEALVEVCAACVRAGIEAIALKGPTFASWLYALPSARRYFDCDILIDPARSSEGEVVLSDLGFSKEPDDAIEGDIPTHTSSWIRARDGVQVELHTTLPGISVDAVQAWRLLRLRVEPFVLHGKQLTGFDESARALHVALHAAHHGMTEPHPLRDLELALERVPLEMWRDASELADGLGATEAFAAGLRLAPRGRTLARDLRLPDEQSFWVALKASGSRRSALSFEWLIAQRGVRRKLVLIARKVFPPPEYLRLRSPIARRGNLGLALAYLYRPFDLLRSIVPGMVDWYRVRRKFRHR